MISGDFIGSSYGPKPNCGKTIIVYSSFAMYMFSTNVDPDNSAVATKGEKYPVLEIVTWVDTEEKKHGQGSPLWQYLNHGNGEAGTFRSWDFKIGSKDQQLK